MFLRSFPSWGYLETKTIFGGFWKIVVRVRHMGNHFPLSRDKHKHFWNHHLCKNTFPFNISLSPQRDDEKHGQRAFSKTREWSHHGSYHEIVNLYILSFFAVSYLRTWKHPIVQLDIFEKKKENTSSKELVTNTAGVPSAFGVLYGWLGPSAALLAPFRRIDAS